MTARRGIALVLIVGVLSLLTLAALGLAAVVQISVAASGARELRDAARLAAASGMDYAAARLVHEGYPRRALAPAGRADDWTREPAYAHGEPWTDADGDVAWDAGEPCIDLDGDGRWSDWTVRLRRGNGPAPRFALWIESPEGRIPVNAGFLDGANRNGPPSAPSP